MILKSYLSTYSIQPFPPPKITPPSPIINKPNNSPYTIISKQIQISTVNMHSQNPQQLPLSSSVSETYLQKTIAMKNNHIAELLEQLKKTQQLHANLKKKYMTDQQKLKEKVGDLQRIVEELRTQNVQLIKKYKMIQASNHSNENKFNKLGNQWEREIQSFRTILERLKLENSELKAEKTDLEHRIKSNTEQLDIKQAKILQLSNRVKYLQTELAETHKKHQEKQEEWKKWNENVTSSLKQLQTKSTQRKRMTLDDIESKIRNIMIDL